MLKRVLLALVRCYQLLLSPLLGDCCRFEPSCSRYAAACLEHLGPWRGSWLTLRRLARCNPLFPGGVDMPPLPPGADQSAIEPDWERLAQRVDCACGHVHLEAPATSSSAATVESPNTTGRHITPIGANDSHPPNLVRVSTPFPSTTER